MITQSSNHTRYSADLRRRFFHRDTMVSIPLALRVVPEEDYLNQVRGGPWRSHLTENYGQNMFVSVGLTNNLRFSSQLAVIISANSKEKGSSPACRQNFFFLDSRICHPPNCSARWRRRRARTSQRRLRHAPLELGISDWAQQLGPRSQMSEGIVLPGGWIPMLPMLGESWEWICEIGQRIQST